MPADKVQKASTAMFSYVMVVDVVGGERVPRWFRIPKGAEKGEGCEVAKDKLPDDVRYYFAGKI